MELLELGFLEAPERLEPTECPELSEPLESPESPEPPELSEFLELQAAEHRQEEEP